MIGALTLLLVFQLAGEVLVRALALPLPGPVLGMALLFAALVLRNGPSDTLRNTATGLLQHLSLLFVPAGAGVMIHFSRIGGEWPAIVGALVASTALTLIVTALVLRLLLRRKDSSAP